MFTSYTKYLHHSVRFLVVVWPQNTQGNSTCTDPSAVKGKVVLLIDDVATTGATLEGCAEALKAAGAKKVMAYTLAREV